MAFGSSRRRSTTPDYARDIDGTTLLRNPSFLADLRDYYRKRGVYIDDDRTLVERFHRDQTFMGMNTLGGIGGILKAKSASKEGRAQQRRLRDAYQKLPMFFEQGGIGAAGAGNIGAAMLLDPLNLVGFGAGAGARAGTKLIAAGATGAQATRAGAKAGAVRGAVAEGVVGAGSEAVMSGIQQGIDLELGLQDNFSMGRLVFDAAAGGVMGGALGAGFGAAGGAIATRRAHRGARLAAMEKLGYKLPEIQRMSDDQMANILSEAGMKPEEIDKAGAAMDAATGPTQPEQPEQPTATFDGAFGGGSRDPALDSDRSLPVAEGDGAQFGGMDPYTQRGYRSLIVNLNDEDLASAKANADAERREIEADKAADPDYAPEDAEADNAALNRAIDEEIARRAAEQPKAEEAPADGAPAQEGAEATDTADEAPVAPKIRIHPSTRKLAEDNGVDVETVFAGQKRVNKKQVQDYIAARDTEQAASNPMMVEAEATLSRTVADIETAGGDVTNQKEVFAELERLIEDEELRRMAQTLYKESREFTQKSVRREAPAATAKGASLDRVQKMRVANKKADLIENDPNMSEAEAERIATASVLGTKAEEVPSNFGESRRGSSAARAERELAEGPVTTGQTIQPRTDVRTGERYYSTRVSKILRRGFSVGDGRTVTDRNLVPTRGDMPREEAVARAKMNAENGTGPTLVSFTAKVSTRAQNGKMIERGETGYADGVSGKIFASKGDYEAATGRSTLDAGLSERMLIEADYQSGNISAAEAARLIGQHEANETAGTFNSLHSIPTSKGNLVAAIRYIPGDISDPVRILSLAQAAEGRGVRPLLAKKGGPQSNPANWELAYVARPTEKGKEAKAAAFDAAEVEGTVEQAAITPRADGTEEGGPPALNDIAEITVPLSPEQTARLTEIARRSPRTPREFVTVIQMGVIQYGHVWQLLNGFHSAKWPRTEAELDVLLETLSEVSRLQSELFPRGVKMPEVERTKAIEELKNALGKLDEADLKLVETLFDGMQTGGAPAVVRSDGPVYRPITEKGEISLVGMPDLSVEDARNVDYSLRARGPIFVHEAMHWLYRHGMTAKERQLFWESTRKFYKDGTLDMAELKKKVPGPGTAGNKLESPQEYFANQGMMYFTQREATPEMVDFWQKMGERIKQFIKGIMDPNRVDDELRPLFARLLSDPEGERHRLSRFSEPRRDEGVHIFKRFTEQGEIDQRMRAAMIAGDDAGILSSAQDLLSYLNSIGMSRKEAEFIARRQKVQPRTTGVFYPVKSQYLQIRVMREKLYEIISGNSAEHFDEGVYTDLGPGFQIEGGIEKGDELMDLYREEGGIKELLVKIDDLYSSQYEIVERGQLNRLQKRGKTSLSAEATAETRRQLARADARLDRQLALIQRLESNDTSMGEALLDQDAVIDATMDGDVTVSSIRTVREMMAKARELRNEPDGRVIAHLVGRRLRAGELDLPASTADDELLQIVRDMETTDLADTAFDLLRSEPDPTEFTDDTLVAVMAELKNRIDISEGIAPENPFVPDPTDLGLVNHFGTRPSVRRLQMRMDIRGEGAEDLRTMFGRLLNLRGKGSAEAGDANLPMESDAAAISGQPISTADAPLLETSLQFRELRSALRGVTTRLLRGDDKAMAELAGMATRAALSPRERDLIAQLGDDIGETVAKRLRGERTGLNELPNRSEVSDALQRAQEATAYTINGIVKDSGMRQRYWRAHIYGDMDTPMANKPHADVFDPKKPVPPSIAAEVASEVMDAGGLRLRRGVNAFTRGTVGEGQVFYAQTPDGSPNHTGGVASGGPAGAAVYVSAAPGGVPQRRNMAKAAKPELTAELNSRLAALEEQLSAVRAAIADGGPHVAIRKAERTKLLKYISAVRGALAENNTPASSVTPVVIAARSLADLTESARYNAAQGLPVAISDYLGRTNSSAAQSFRADMIGKTDLTGAELMDILSGSVGPARMAQMFRGMGYDGIQFRRGASDEIALYRTEQVSALTNPALTMPEMAMPTDTQPRIYDSMGDQMVMAMSGERPDPARIEIREEMRVEQGMDPELSELIADMERGANGELPERKVSGMVRTYNRFMRGIADRMSYLGHEQIANRFRSFELDQRQQLASYVTPLMDVINKARGDNSHILKRTWDYLNEPRRGKGRHRLAHKQSASENRILKALRMGEASDAYRLLNDDERTAYTEVRKAYRDVHDRMRAEGIPIGDLGSNYFGQVWDQDHIRRNIPAFRKLLIGLYNAERGLEVSSSEAAVTAHRMDSEAFAEGVIRSIVGNDTNGILPTTDFDGNGNPINAIEHSRVLHFQKYPALHEQAMEFMDGSLMGNIVRYMDQATRKINHTKNFGLGGHIAYDYVKVAQEGRDGVAKLLSSDKVFTRQMTMVDGNNVDRTEVRYKVPAPFARRPELARQLAEQVTIMVNSGDVKGAQTTLMQFAPKSGDNVIDRGFERRAEAIIDGLRDHRGEQSGFATADLDALEANMLYAVRRGQGGNDLANNTGRLMRRFNNVTLLAFTTLTSFSDIAMPLLRTGDFKAFARGWKSFLKATVTADDETKRALRRIGVGMDGVVASRLTEMTGDGADVVQDVFFRGTGLTGWTNMNSQISGLIGLESFRAEQARAVNLHNPDVSMAEQSPAFKKAFRYLAHFGLDFRKDTFDLKDASVGNAVNQFVKETIFAPTPNELPSWANNGPWFKTVAQLKSFPMMYERLVTNMASTTYSGMREAMAKGDIVTAASYLGPAGVFILAPLFGIGANSAKDVVMGRGGEDNDEFGKVAAKRLSEDFIFKGLLADQEAFDAFMGHYIAGMFTAGGLGLLGQMIYDSSAQMDNDAYGRERMASLMMGPSFSVVFGDVPKVASGLLAIPDPEGKSRRRTAVRTVTSRIPIAGQIRPFRETVVDTVAGEVEEKSSDSYGVSSYGSRVSGYGRS